MPYIILDKAVKNTTTTNNLLRMQGGSIQIVHKDTVILG